MLLHGGQGMAFTSLLMIRPADGTVAALVGNNTELDGTKGITLMKVLADMTWPRGK
ncbi:MAG: hypothetical protein JNK82_29250 [Myxococcaceae bacterium]|nr:hypothetical protein [Myxococcaceae bacterium]